LPPAAGRRFSFEFFRSLVHYAAMLQLEEARERILRAVRVVPAEQVPLLDAWQRTVAADLAAPIDLPPFDNSAMDGYAVVAADLQTASRERSIVLKVTAQIPAGAKHVAAIASGQCARIFTGSPIPSGADAVVMQEDVALEGGIASFTEPVKPWENVRFRGEDVKRGAVAVRAGDRVMASSIALLGALGMSEVAVHRRPVVAMLATGSELREPGEKLGPGQIYESNRAALARLLASAGAVPRLFPLVSDSLEAVREALRRGFDECDMVVTTGGVSVGEFDLVKDAFAQLGGKLDFWRVAIRPGKPFVCGTLGEKLLLGLPGNPVSAFVTAALLVWPVVLRAQGATDVGLPSQHAVARDTFFNKSDRRHFMRVRVDAEGGVSLSGLQASHALSSLAAANGLIDVSAGSVIERGADVQVLRFPS
jgi:molybdopterin molybdotransferase